MVYLISSKHSGTPSFGLFVTEGTCSNDQVENTPNMCDEKLKFVRDKIHFAVNVSFLRSRV